MGLVSPTLNKTCEWREVSERGATVDAKYQAIGTGVFDPGHAIDGYCQAVVQSHVNAPARGRWTMHTAVFAGPGRSSKPRDALFVNASMEAPVGGCTTAGSCGAVVGAPVGAASATYDLSFTFFTTDPVIKRTQDSFVFKFFVRHALTKCRGAKPPPLVADRVDFGPTDLMVQQGLPGNRRYFLQSYRAYKLRGVRGARWSVRVSRTLGGGEKTPLVVLLMREEDYVKWAYGCTSTCAPPIGQALPGTISTAVTATGRAAGLNPAAAYRLVVSYPRVHHDSWENTFWYQPIDWSEFNKQYVTVEAWAT